MIGFIKGTVFKSYTDYVLIDQNGIGLMVYTSSFTKNRILAENCEVFLFTYLHVREGELILYGFFTEEEKSMFLNLISISGIGPKAAITILSGFPINSLALAIISQDIKTLSKIKGVGKKTAERIVLELKEKITKEHLYISSHTISLEDELAFDAIEALCSLGISRSDASLAVTKVKTNSSTLEDVIYNALRSLN